MYSIDILLKCILKIIWQSLSQIIRTKPKLFGNNRVVDLWNLSRSVAVHFRSPNQSNSSSHLRCCLLRHSIWAFWCSQRSFATRRSPYSWSLSCGDLRWIVRSDKFDKRAQKLWKLKIISYSTAQDFIERCLIEFKPSTLQAVFDFLSLNPSNIFIILTHLATVIVTLCAILRFWHWNACNTSPSSSLKDDDSSWPAGDSGDPNCCDSKVFASLSFGELTKAKIESWDASMEQ